MVKISKIYKTIIIICTMYLLGYFNLLLGDRLNARASLIRLLIAFVAILMAIAVRTKRNSNDKMRKYFEVISKYMWIYISFITISSVYTYLEYGYSVKELLFSISSFGFVFFAYPIVYVFCIDGSYVPFMKKIVMLVVGMLLIKAVIWWLYVYQGRIYFDTILFQYQGWQRAGLLRMDSGYLFGLSYVLILVKALKEKKIIPKALVIGMFAFAIVITQFRFQIGVMFLTLAVVYYYSTVSSNRRRNRIVFILILLSIFAFSGGMQSLIDSFSTTGVHGGSTLARLDTIAYYWHLMKERKAIIGLGMLSTYSSAALNLISKGTDSFYYLEDLGLLGGFYRFGILTLGIYGFLFKTAISSCIEANRKKDDILPIIIGVTCYMIVSCLLLNIFDNQRALNVPFDLAMISYLNGVVKNRTNSFEL